VRLNASDDEYELYRTFKNPVGVTNPRLREAMTHRAWAINNHRHKANFIDNFERHVCLRVHERLAREKLGLRPIPYRANVDHYGCPIPKRFVESSTGSLTRVVDKEWAQEWIRTRYKAVALRLLVDNNASFSGHDVVELAWELRATEERLS